MATLLRINIDAQTKLFLLKAPFKEKRILSASSRELTNHVLTKCSPRRHFIISVCNFNILKKLFSVVWHQEKRDAEEVSNGGDLNQSVAEEGRKKWKILDYKLRLPALNDGKTEARSFPYFNPSHYTTVPKPIVNKVSRADTIDLKACHDELLQTNERFLKTFPSALDKMSRNLIHFSKAKLKSRKKPVPKPRVIQKKTVLYPLRMKGDNRKVKLDSYNSSYEFLSSIGLPCDELEYYPDIQMMSNNEVLDSLIELKKYGIERVFSLFLISRVHLELTNKERLRPDSKIVKYSKRKLLCFKQVRSYIELCQALEIPDLDINGFLDTLAEIGIYDDIHFLLKKVKVLISVGAKPQDIMNNLDLLQGYEFFFEKIDLYRSILQKASVPSFPVKLFQAKTMAAFQEQMSFDTSTKDVADELGLGLRDLQECWDLYDLKSGQLYYKIRMCLNAGISKQDILNNLKMLDRLPIEKCYDATKCFQASGLPVSVFLLQEMEKTLKMNGVTKDTSPAADNDHSETEDWTSSDSETHPMVQDICRDKGSKLRTAPKTLRTQVVYLVGKKLDLDRSAMWSLFDCGVDTTNFDIQDVFKNYEFLCSAGFTIEQLAACPLVLINPTEKLIRVTRNVRDLVRSYLQSSSYTLAAGDDAALHPESDLTGDNAHVFNEIFSCPVKQLNTIQYFLDKQNSFNPVSYNLINVPC